MTLMKQLASADFRKQYQSQAEPVEVTAWGKVIGTWIPAGSTYETPENHANGDSHEADEAAPPVRMTIRPAKGPKKDLVATSTRVLDPLEAARRERERYAQLASRMYGTKRTSKD